LPILGSATFPHLLAARSCLEVPRGKKEIGEPAITQLGRPHRGMSSISEHLSFAKNARMQFKYLKRKLKHNKPHSLLGTGELIISAREKHLTVKQFADLWASIRHRHFASADR
jgi:hypothetical protein